MRVLEYSTVGAGRRVGVVVGGGGRDGVVDLTARHPDSASTLHHLLQRPDWRRLVAGATEADPDLALDEVTHEPFLADTGRVFAIGLNYVKTAPVGGTRRASTPDHPPWFTKVPGTLVGHGQPVVAPIVSDSFDYEAELAVVVGSPGRHVPLERALDLVAGWTCLDDGSVRHWQRHSVNAGKNFERSGSIGPWLVTGDEIDDPQALELEARVDGEVRQRASTGAMIFTVAEIIAYLSQILELRPGDVIATGSPEGSGGSFDPPRFLTPGQLLEVEIEGIGVLRNPVVAEAPTG